MKKFQRMTALLLLFALVLTGCGRDDKKEEAVQETTQTLATEPVPTAPPDGNPNDVTCKGSYTASAVDGSGVVAKVGSAQLTNALLNQYYWAEVAACTEGPDWNQGLDTQLHSSGITWQQYFLRRALDTWHTHQALIQMGQQDTFQPSELYVKYLTGTAVEEEKLYTGGFQLNEMHQAYVDSLPERVAQLAPDNSDAAVEYAQLTNRAYAYFTQLSYDMEPSEEEIQALAAGSGEKTVDIRHILFIPADTAEESWAEANAEAEKILSKWRGGKRVTEGTFAEMANEFSQDPGSDLHGGLYRDIRAGQLESTLDAWAFAPERQRGDCEIVRSSIGVHILYFCGSRTTGYQEAKAELIGRMAQEQVSQARENCPMQVTYSAIALTEKGGTMTMEDILYPDVAHERYSEVPLYFQQDYADDPYGNYTVGSHGCGIAAMAMIASYMMDKEITPADMGANYGEYCMVRGTDLTFFSYVPAEEGYFLEQQVFNWTEVGVALNEGKLVISQQYPGIFTRTGHFLVLTHLNEEGRVMMRDSNIYNYRRYDGYKEGFSIQAITSKCVGYWIFSKKVLSTPSCVRCGDLENIPQGLLSGEYFCEKCIQATTRRTLFPVVCTSE